MVRAYYWRWFWNAFRWSHLFAAGLSGAIAQYGPPVARLLRLKDADATVSVYAWQIPLLFVVMAILFRIVAAPYWMHEEDETRRESERVKERERLAEEQADRHSEKADADRKFSDVSGERDRIERSFRELSDDRQWQAAEQQRREAERLRQEEQKASLAEVMSDGSKLRDWMPADRRSEERRVGKECLE